MIIKTEKNAFHTSGSSHASVYFDDCSMHFRGDIYMWCIVAEFTGLSDPVSVVIQNFTDTLYLVF